MYLDPGFGSMVIQLVVGVIAAGATFFWLFRQKIKKLFGLESKSPDEHIAEDASSGKAPE
jgi:hypothetical protein